MVAPTVTVTEAGTVRAALFEESPTDAPPFDAAEFSVTVQLEVAPEVTELGEHDRTETARLGGVTVTVAVLVAPLKLAVTVTV